MLLADKVRATDAVGVVSRTQVPAAGTVLPLGTYSVTLSAADAAGNSTTVETTLTVAFPAPSATGDATVLAHVGSPAPETPGLPDGVKLKSVTSLSLRDGQLVALVKLAAARGVVAAGRDDVALVALSAGSPPVGTRLLRTGADFAVRSTLVPRRAGVTAKNDTVLLFSAEGEAWTVLAREGDPISPDEGAPRFATFFDPVVNAGQVAFQATLQGSGVNAKNRTALFAGSLEEVQPVARLGEIAPGESAEPSGAVWTRFVSHALPGGSGAGLVFLAEVKGGDTPPKGKLALWAVDSAGHLRRIFRTGVALTAGGPSVTGLALLEATPGAYGTGRSTNGNASIAVLATFADRSQALIRLDVP